MPLRTKYEGGLQMKIIDCNGELTAVTALTPASVTANGVGAVIDLQGFQGTGKMVLHIGTPTGTAPTMDVKVTECATTDGTYTDVAGLAFPQKTAAGISSIAIDPRAVKRYIKLALTIGGSVTPTFPMSAALIGQKDVI